MGKVSIQLGDTLSLKTYKFLHLFIMPLLIPS